MFLEYILIVLGSMLNIVVFSENIRVHAEWFRVYMKCFWVYDECFRVYEECFRQGLKSSFASWEQRGDFGLLPANISIQTIEYIDFMTAKSNFNSKSGLPSWEEGPFLGAVLPRSLYFSDPGSLYILLLLNLTFYFVQIISVESKTFWLFKYIYVCHGKHVYIQFLKFYLFNV